jgi:hypothetical protein
MSAADKPLFKAQDMPAPQYYNPKTGEYEVITGRNGANSFIEKGRVVKDAFNGSESVSKTYPMDMFGFGIVNDGIADLTFSIGAFTLTVKPGETFDDLFEPFTTVVVTATDAFRAVVRE